MTYPIRFKPVFKTRIWGSHRLKTLFHKPLPEGERIGESWELADLPEGQSFVDNGPLAGISLRQFLEQYGQEFGFTAEQCLPPFGLLIKFLDAADILSVQVHPDQKACKKFPGANLKTECWYVIHAEPGSMIYRGLKDGVTRQAFADALNQGTVQNLLMPYPAHAGDFHFLPAGTVHALGAGLVVAEIQTPSDTTFRVFDWNRRDEKGHTRPLHIEQALESIHFDSENSASPPPLFGEAIKPFTDLFSVIGNTTPLLSCPYFMVLRSQIDTLHEACFRLPSPAAMIVLRGEGQIVSNSGSLPPTVYRSGDTLLLPAGQNLMFQVRNPSTYLFSAIQ